MVNKIILGLLVLLFFTLPLINSHLFDLIGIKWDFYVDGNYEFTKVMFFNIFSGIILSLFFLKSFFSKNKIIVPKIIFPIFLVLLISTIFSDYNYTSFLGNNTKAHSLLMFINIIGLFIILINLKLKYLKQILLSVFLSLFLVLILGIKEYYFPTFNYGNLSNRAISTFGHPNYLALYILILIPFLVNKFRNILISKNKFTIQNIFFIVLLSSSVFVLFLTKSVLGIILFLFYLIVLFSKSFPFFGKRKLQILSLFFGIIILFILIYKFGFVTKLSSFISRFYIWETTLNIIFSDIKTLIIGNGLGTLDLVFDSFKVKELYIFENIGFTADRPHNIFLNYFYHFGLLGLSLLLFLIYKFIFFIKNINFQNKNTYYYKSIILFLLFCFLNFPSISHYLLIILVISFIYKTNNISKNIYFLNFNFLKKYDIYINKILILIILIISIFSAIFSFNYYKYEHKRYIDSNNITTNNFIKNIIIESNKYKNFSVNDYFYLGNIYWQNDKKESLKYYNLGLELLPDMWNKNSLYYNNYLIDKLFSRERFYSENFSDLEKILKRVGKNNF